MNLNVLKSGLQLFGHPGIETFPGDGCGEIDSSVKFRWDARDELAGEGFFRLLSPLLAEIEVVVN